MRLKFVFCVAAMLALCSTSLPAAAGCGKYRHGCGGHYAYGYSYAHPTYTYTYTYAYPAYSYGYPAYSHGYGHCGRVHRRNCYGYRVYTVPAPTIAVPCRRRRCW